MLEIVAGHHSKWLDIASTFVGRYNADDIIQEFYIKLHKYTTKDKLINEQNEVNPSYCFLIIRSLSINFLKSENKYTDVEIKECSEAEIKPLDTKQEFYCNIRKEIDTWCWYDKELFNLYHNSNKSIRDLSKETGISTGSIFNTLKNCKEKLNEKFKDDYFKALNYE